MRSNPAPDNPSLVHRPPRAPSKQPNVSPVSIDTSSVTQRLQKELMSLMMTGVDLGVSAFPQEEGIFNWIGTIEGGKGTIYEDLSYKLSLRFPVDYPFKPPVVKFETACFHPNVDQYGNICLDILQIPITKAPSTIMLPHFGATKKNSKRSFMNNIQLEKCPITDQDISHTTRKGNKQMCISLKSRNEKARSCCCYLAM